jgi:hypothetical protein
MADLMMPDLNQLLGTMLYRDLREEIKVLVYLLYIDCKRYLPMD